jgi:hypothetical protein
LYVLVQWLRKNISILTVSSNLLGFRPRASSNILPSARGSHDGVGVLA